MSDTMPLILITNDDGIHSPGLQVLVSVLRPLARCVIVAPDRDNSAVSHSLTMNRPLKVTDIQEDFYSLDGTPTDCVAIGLNKILEQRPVLLVSGINPGPNLGDDIAYSGTVSAAVEGTMYGIPSLAVSLAGTHPYDFTTAGHVAAWLARTIMEKGLPENTLLNANIPAVTKISGVKVTRQGRRLWQNSIQETLDPWGRKHYWIGGGTPHLDPDEDTDANAINAGYISVTPIHLDLTNHAGLDYLKDEWALERKTDEGKGAWQEILQTDNGSE
jgi:5'-nucleotidase